MNTEYKYFRMYNFKKACTLTFEQKVVYSYLTYRTRFDKQTTIQHIADRLKLRPANVKSTLLSLLNQNLIHQVNNKYTALPPNNMLMNCLVSTNNKDCCGARFYLPNNNKIVNSNKRLTLKHYAILSIALDLGRQHRPISQAGIATILSISVRTVNSTLKLLTSQNLLQLTYSPITKRYAVTPTQWVDCPYFISTKKVHAVAQPASIPPVASPPLPSKEPEIKTVQKVNPYEKYKIDQTKYKKLESLCGRMKGTEWVDSIEVQMENIKEKFEETFVPTKGTATYWFNFLLNEKIQKLEIQEYFYPTLQEVC